MTSLKLFIIFKKLMYWIYVPSIFWVYLTDERKKTRVQYFHYCLLLVTSHQYHCASITLDWARRMWFSWWKRLKLGILGAAGSFMSYILDTFSPAAFSSVLLGTNTRIILENTVGALENLSFETTLFKGAGVYSPFG